MEIKDLIKLKNKSYKYFTEEEALAAVKRSGYNLQYVKNQTEEICIEAVKQNAHALQYVKNQTEEICLAAVDQDLDTVRYINIDLKPEAKELSVEEISDLLGYEVKIIKYNG